MKTIIGTVQALDGKYFAKDADGSVITLKVGDTITEDMIVFGDVSNSANAMIQVTILNLDDSIVLRGNDEQLFDSSLFDNDTLNDPIANESLSEAFDSSVLSEETDENAQDDEETAAGEETAPGGQSLDDVFAARDGNSVDINTNIRNASTSISNTGTESDNNIFPVIADENVAPVAIDDQTVVVADTATTNEDAAIDIDVLANDTDTVDGTDAAISPVASVTQGTNGSVTINANGTVKYTPNADFNGEDTFTYTNVEGNTETVTVTVDPLYTVSPVSTSVAEGGVKTGFFTADMTPNYAEWSIDLSNTDTTSVALDLDNGSIDGSLFNFLENTEWGDFTGLEYKDVNGDWQDIDASFLNPTNGTVSVAATDTELVVRTKITPDLWKETDEIFHLNVTIDGITKSSEVTIENDDWNRAPVAENDVYSMNEDSVLTLDLLANDSDPDTNLIYTDTVMLKSINGIALTAGVAQSITVLNGTVNIDASGGITFNPSLNYNGNIAFNYVITDGALEDTGSVNITVNPVNDLTVVNNDTATTNEDAAIDIDVLANDTDTVDGANAAISAVASVTDGSNGTVTINADGTVKYTPNANWSGDDSFTYTNEEGIEGTVTVTVLPIADSLLPDGSLAVLIGNPSVINVGGYTDDGNTYYDINGDIVDITGLNNNQLSDAGITSIVTSDGSTILSTDADSFYFNSGNGIGVNGDGAQQDRINTDDSIVYEFANYTNTITIEFKNTASTDIPVTLYGLNGVEVAGTFVNNTGNNGATILTFVSEVPFNKIRISGTASDTDGFYVDKIYSEPALSTIVTYPLTVTINMVDVDGSENLGAITLSELPTDSILTGTGVVDNNDGTWTVPSANLDTSTGLLTGIWLTTADSASSISPTISVVTIDGDTSAITIVGGDSDSDFVGTAGNDYIDGGAGDDNINAGGGDDHIKFDIADTGTIDGGAGADTLILQGDMTLDFSDTNIANIQNIESISLETGIQDITISLDDVLSMTDTSNTLTIKDTTLDTLTIAEDGSQNVTITNNGWTEADIADTNYSDGKVYSNDGGDSITLTVDETAYTIV